MEIVNDNADLNIEQERNIVKNEVEVQLDEQKKISEERLNKLKYMQADFENLKKQFEKERRQIIRLANDELISELIIILDDFESSIKMIKDEVSKEGMGRIYKKFYMILKRHGLSKIEATGKKLNPEYHYALIKEKSEKEDDEIIEELQKGYLLHSKVIRPAKVKISEKFKNDTKTINNEGEKQNE